jgi:hypothetical protein
MIRLLRVALVFGLGLAAVAGCDQPPVSTNKDTQTISKEKGKSISVTAEDPSAKQRSGKKN